MPPPKTHFSLSETVAGVFAEICDAYNIDNHWLSWRYEREILTDGASPFRINTNDLVQKNRLKEGVDKVTIEIEFNQDNPNVLKWIRFNELPSKKHYLVTQTSIDHIQQNTGCPIWLELPPAARKEDIGAVQALLKVKVCCNEWKDFLPISPYTELERAHRIVAAEDIDWIRKQLAHKDSVALRLTNALECKIAEVTALQEELGKLKIQLEEKSVEPDEREIKKRRVLTPKTRTPKTPKTAKASTLKGSDSSVREEPATTPTKTPTKMHPAMERLAADDPFVF